MGRRLVVEADGGSRGNPGPAAYGAVVRDAVTGEVLVEVAEHIGTASNNVAEYRGVIAGLTAAKGIDPDAQVEVRLDSKLVVEQLSGRWQVKHPDMRVLARQALAVWPGGDVTYTWVPRERNKHADRLVNEALDAGAAGRPWTPRALPVPPALEVPSVEAPANRLVGWAPDPGPPTTFRLLRHGQTEHTREKRFSGSGGADPGLTDVGLGQARAALALLRGRPVDTVVASPLRRTRETAAVVAAALGHEVRVEDGLRECAFGEWEGLTFAEVEEGWPDELAAWLGSTAVTPPGGESFDEVAARVRRTRDRLIARHPGRALLLVTHVTPIKTLVRLALDAPAQALFRMELAPASLTTVAWFGDGNASLRAFNETPQHP
ncbi:MAG: bifunctional RNase H/acid phosphatase [Actinomycetia bacterium]|nr:bifunctional RNase H/acid phosphatase [Actinomycetes bacterium]